MRVAQGQPVADSGQVLLVDDDAGVLCAMRRVLEGAGYDVVACSSGDDALAALATQSFVVMITDIQMPGTCGLKLLRAVREHDLDLPVILVTGDPAVPSVSKAVEYGAFRYLIKPVSMADLRSVVGRAASVGHVARSKREYLASFGSGRFRVGDRAGADETLDRALSSLWMAYQPIVRARDSTLFAYEALMRAEEPLLSHPVAVLAAAERAGRLLDVGRAIRDRVVFDSRANEDTPMVFVNLHPEDLRDATLYLPNSPFALLAHRVVLEITERMALDYVPDVSDQIASLRALGFQIALDDLGAGYAGLTSFTQLEPEYVKLDMPLVRDVHEDRTKQKIIRSMVRLCHDTGKQIIAEGVERVEERDVLVELDCDLLQGYLFAKPGKPFPIAASPTCASAV
jgi:EAL domain-containing protein (putative c-di-GMP-specific phosphodiesterase class I)/ActR/RegA family two-component response regulator